MVFPDPGICARLFPAELSAFVTDYYREKGVEVLTGETVESAANGHRADGRAAPSSKPTR